MCGIWMVVAKVNIDENMRMLAKALALLNEDRGDHSWGIWNQKQEIMKEDRSVVIDSFELSDFISKWTDSGRWTFIAGHTRHATHGGRSRANAHPFAHGNLILAHNGVVTVEGFSHSDHPVDSGRIAMAICRHGYAEGMAKVEGSCGLVLSVGDMPMVYRHDQVLSIVETETCWAISSEKDHLRMALAMADIDYIKIETVEPDKFIAPWANVIVDAPAKKKSYASTGSSSSYCSKGWRGHGYEYEGGIEDPWDWRNYSSPSKPGAIDNKPSGNISPLPVHSLLTQDDSDDATIIDVDADLISRSGDDAEPIHVGCTLCGQGFSPAEMYPCFLYDLKLNGRRSACLCSACSDFIERNIDLETARVYGELITEEKGLTREEMGELLFPESGAYITSIKFDTRMNDEEMLAKFPYKEPENNSTKEETQKEGHHVS